jgi:hypothetical protein
MNDTIIIKPIAIVEGIEPIYSLEDTARMFGKSVDRIRKWVRSGLLTARRNGPAMGDIVFYKKDIEAFRSKPVRG